jgi:hypothetical protein|tara:strand:+ start:153 stop:413 length:261 start_codon:yes stop_codon:yes gene_type:complete
MKQIQKILSDLDKHIKNEEPTDDYNEPNKYNYNRMDFVKNNLSKRDDLYDIGLENLRVLIYQLSFFNKHILTDENVEEINKIITEK